MAKTSYNFENGRKVGAVKDSMLDSIKDVQDVVADACEVAKKSGSDVLIAAAEEFEAASQGQLKNLNEMIANCEQYCAVYKASEQAHNR